VSDPCASGKERRAGLMRSPAARISNCRALPADHGPRKVPKIPRAAMTARNNSVSKYSPTRSATAIGPQRRDAVQISLAEMAEGAGRLQHAPEIPLLGWSISVAWSRELPRLLADLSQRLLELGIFSRHLFARRRRWTARICFRLGRAKARVRRARAR